MIPTTRGAEDRAIAKVWWRIVPLLALVLLFNYLDKVNIGFAALQMNKELGLSNSVFGVASGLFSFGYALAAVPSTLALERIGARRWMSYMMVAWGLCSAGTALVSRPGELVVARVVLGVAEAGFTPGVILYLTYWFPAEYRGRVLASFLLILPLSLVIGGPISGALLSCNGLLGLAGWKWLFLCEGLPTVLLAGIVAGLLADRPGNARWLSNAEKTWLIGQLDETRPEKTGLVATLRALANWRVVLLAAALLGITTSGGGALIFLPIVIRSMGFSVGATGLVAALPAVVAAFVFPLWGIWTDRSPRREGVVAVTCLAVSVGLCGAAALLPSPWALVPLTIAFVGFFGSVVPFWTLPPSFLSGASAAAGIALINIAGNLGGFSGPALLGWLSDATRSYNGGLAGLAGPAALAGVILWLLPASSPLGRPVGNPG
jgi:ACS family tartrate transporter-like MFS transporter